MIGLIWAQARDNLGRPVIGAGGRMPWHLPEDLAHFRAVTDGHPVVMGRGTWESLPPRFRPLPGRTNVVLTRRPGWSPEETVPRPPGSDGAGTSVAVVASLAAAFVLAARTPGGEEVWVIGGGQVYAESLAVADRCVVTEVDLLTDGDTYAPTLGEAWTLFDDGGWRTGSGGLRFRFREYRRETA